MYPQPVQQVLDGLSKAIQQALQAHTNKSIVFDDQAFEETFGPVVFERWKIGEEDLRPSASEALDLLFRYEALRVINSLVKDGLIDSVEDEHGEQVFFLTELGKKQVEEFGKTYPKQHATIKQLLDTNTNE